MAYVLIALLTAVCSQESANQEKLARLIRELGAENPDRRSKASLELINYGYETSPLLRKALGSISDKDTRAQIRAVLWEVDPWFEDRLMATLPSGWERWASPVFAPNGRTVAYISGHGVDMKGRWMVVGSKAGEEFDEVSPATFSQDGKRIAYLATKGEKGEEAWMVIDGKKSARYDDVGAGVVFSPINRTAAYVATSGDASFLVVGSVPRKKFDKSKRLFFFQTFSPDGKTLAYVAYRDGKPILVRGDKERELPYDDARWPVYSPDGKTVAYDALKDGQWFVVVGEQEGKPYDGVGGASFSPDGKRVAYRANKGGRKGPYGYPEGGKWFVVIGEEVVSEEYDFVGSLVFAPNGTSVAYAARRGSETLLVTNGRKEKVEFANISSLTFSPNGSVIAYLGFSDGYKKCQVVAGSRHSSKFDVVLTQHPIFSPDGKRVAFGARKGRELWWKVMDVE